MNQTKKLDYFSLWEGMPEFKQEKQKPFFKIVINVADEKSLNELSKRLDQKITPKTKSLWYPHKSHWRDIKKVWKSEMVINPRYPVYIVSKGRAKNGLTTRTLHEMGVPHYIVVEPQEFEEYKKGRCFGELLILPDDYKKTYDTFDNLSEKSTGPGAARNFCIDHSTKSGYSHHWVMDDNIESFNRLHQNEKFKVKTGAIFRACENFILRFSNVPLAGLNYLSFCKKTDPAPPFSINTRIYSCLLYQNDCGYRWRGRYNEDTDLSLRILKDGFCTIQFNAFLCGKVTTQRMRGGNTDDFYKIEGTLPKSKMLEDMHPDVTKITYRFGRYHHYVDYRKFKSNSLLLFENCMYHHENNYGMFLKEE
jgi:hypothetical protein